MILFARNFKGDIKVWSIEQISTGFAKIKYGIFNGKLIEEDVCDTAKEVQARITKKKKEGYKSLTDLNIPHNNQYTIEDLHKALPQYNTDNNWNIKPMKCQPFAINTCNYAVLGQTKINGLRAILRWETTSEGEGMFKKEIEHAVFRTKEGNKYSLPHITSPLKKEMFEYNGVELVFDGELYIHGKGLSYIKASCPYYNVNGTLSKPANDPTNVTFMVFDLAIPDLLQYKRIDILSYINGYSENPFYNKNIKLVNSILINNDDEALVFRDNCIRAGYEGCILRDMKKEYAFGFRPSFMRKYKKHMDSEFLIINIIPKPNDSSLPIFVLKNDINDEQFESVPIGSFDEQHEYLLNVKDYIGKYATVRYRERSGVKQVPFHTNVIDIRETNK